MSDTGTWTGIKSGIISLVNTMSTSAGYNYDYAYFNRNDIHQPNDVYITMDTPEGEDNTDADNFASIGTGQFSNERAVEFYCYLKTSAGDQELDDIVEVVEDNLELFLDDINKRFNGKIPDELCSEGVFWFGYETARWVSVEDGEEEADRYAPIKMIVTYMCKYRKAR